MISKNKQTKSHCLHYCSNLPIALLVFLPSVHLAHHHQVMHPKVTVSSCSSPAQSPQFCSPSCLRLTFYKPSFIFVFSPHTPPFYHPPRAWPRAGTSLMCARGSHCPPGSQSATKGQVAGCWDRKDGGCTVALIDLTQDDLRVLRERRPAGGSELVIMETPDFPGFLQENNWLPSGCPQTYPCQHLLRNRNEIHLIPPARPVPLLFLCFPSSQSPMTEMGAVPASSVLLIFSASLAHQSRFCQVSLSLCLSPGYQSSLWDGSLLPLCLRQSTHHTAASYFSMNLIISLPYLKTTSGIPRCCQNQV